VLAVLVLLEVLLVSVVVGTTVVPAKAGAESRKEATRKRHRLRMGNSEWGVYAAV
jgi:hypothetical protein